MRLVGVIACLAGCREPTRGEPAPVPVAPAVDAAPSMVFDRPPIRVGGPQTWTHAVDQAAIAFCPDGRELVAIDERATVRRFRVANGEQLTSIALGGGPARAEQIECHDGEVVITTDGARQPVRLDRWGSAVRPAQAIPTRTARLLADGTIALATIDRGVLAWRDPDVATRAPHQVASTVVDDGSLLGTRADELQLVRSPGTVRIPVRATDFARAAGSPDGTLLAVVDTRRRAHLFEVGARAKSVGLLRDVDAIAVTDAHVATLHGNLLLVTRQRDGFQREVRDACELAGRAVATSHDGKLVAIACAKPAAIRIYELDTGVQTTDELPSYAGKRLAWSPRGDTLAIRLADGQVAAWRDDRAVVRTVSAGDTVWWHDDDHAAIDTARGILGWRVLDGPLQSLDPTPHVRAATSGERASLVLPPRTRPGDRDVVTALVGGVATEIALPPLADPIAGLAIASDGRRAITTTNPPRRGEPFAISVLELDAGTARALEPVTAATLDNRRVVVARGTTITSELDRAAALPPLAHTRPITALAIAGELVAAGDVDGTIVIWNGAQQVARLAGHDGAVTALAFSAEQPPRLASTATDTTLVWDLRP